VLLAFAPGISTTRSAGFTSRQRILKIAFRDRVVDRADHPLVQRLQGIV
jgi:hypothetical protein